MMLEISPERDFGVLSPAFKGNESFMRCGNSQKTDYFSQQQFM
jgi:hypothetical protein